MRNKKSNWTLLGSYSVKHIVRVATKTKPCEPSHEHSKLNHRTVMLNVNLKRLRGQEPGAKKGGKGGAKEGKEGRVLVQTVRWQIVAIANRHYLYESDCTCNGPSIGLLSFHIDAARLLE